MPPERIPDYLALMGDAVDNIPGIKGVGPKTAVKWISEYGDLAGILAAADRIEPARFREILAGSVELLKKNRELVTFRLDFPTDEADAPAVMDFTGSPPSTNPWACRPRVATTRRRARRSCSEVGPRLRVAATIRTIRPTTIPTWASPHLLSGEITSPGFPVVAPRASAPYKRPDCE